MAYIVGTDEAGYGPNLGPLVISATVWETPEGLSAHDLYECLGKVIISGPPRGAHAKGRVAIADSKVLYQAGGGLKNLERGLWAAFAALGSQPTSWLEAWDTLAPNALDAIRGAPWYRDFDVRLPLAADIAEIEALGPAMLKAFSDADIWLVEMASRAVFPDEFNNLVEQHDSKGTALSCLTLELVQKLCKDLDSGPITVICDKHGGRNHYASLLARFFTDGLIETRGESREESVYRLKPSGRKMEFRFTMKAESCLPVALASMASKYLRELAMLAFNDYWCDQVRGLKPTAGYPQDAVRFKADIEVALKELKIDQRLLWRVK